MEKIDKSDAEWRKQLTPEQYRVMREKGTERPFTGEYEKSKEKGMYVCAGCGNPLFSSDTKYESGSGWPSFWKPLEPANIKTGSRLSGLGMWAEVRSAHADSHLGHVFDDGPQPTGERYCMNSVSLKLQKNGVKK